MDDAKASHDQPQRYRDERRQAFERLQVPPAATLTDATVIRIGELVGASEVIVGTLQLEDDALATADHRSLALVKLLQGIRGRSFRDEFPVLLENAHTELLEKPRKVFGGRRCGRARLP